MYIAIPLRLRYYSHLIKDINIPTHLYNEHFSA